MNKREVRESCLEEINSLTKQMENLLEEVDEARIISIVRELTHDERMEYIEKLQKIVAIRGNIACNYNTLLSCQELDGLEFQRELSVLVDTMREYVLDFEQKLEDSEEELARTLGHIKLVDGVNETGYKLFNKKFDDLYEANTNIWLEASKLCAEVLTFDAEVSGDKTSGQPSSEEDSEPNA